MVHISDGTGSPHPKARATRVGVSRSEQPRRWYRFATTGVSGSRFFGAIVGLGFIAPFGLGAILERAWGDAAAITILAALAALCVGAAGVLLARRRWVDAVLLLPVLAGSAIAIWVTATMDW